jgi:hypothetical protein
MFHRESQEDQREEMEQIVGYGPKLEETPTLMGQRDFARAENSHKEIADDPVKQVHIQRGECRRR